MATSPWIHLDMVPENIGTSRPEDSVGGPRILLHLRLAHTQFDLVEIVLVDLGAGAAGQAGDYQPYQESQTKYPPFRALQISPPGLTPFWHGQIDSSEAIAVRSKIFRIIPDVTEN